MTKRFIAPGLIRDDRAGKWNIRHHPNAGAVNITDREFMAPLGDDPLSIAVARHELEHIARSPDVPPPRYPGVRLFTEDARVNLSMARSGMPFEADWLPEDKAEKLAQAKDFLSVGHGTAGKALVGLLSIACIGTPMEPALSALDPSLAKLIATFRKEHERLFNKEFRAGHRSPACSENTAQKLNLRAVSLVTEFAGVYAEVLESIAQDKKPWVPVLPTGSKEATSPLESEAMMVRLPGRGGQKVEAVQIHIIKPYLKRLSNLNKFGKKRYRNSEDGDVLTSAHRMFVDGRVFRRKNPSGIGGGSIMVDHSGSMQLSADLVRQLTWAAPTRTQVWSYCGGPIFRDFHPLYQETRRAERKNNRIHHGALTRLSISGRVAEPEWAYRSAQGGNEIDLEALQWLSKMPHPRIWVSDGAVCGGIHHETNLEQLCTRQCAEGKIIWVPRIQDAIQLLKDGRRLHWKDFLPFQGFTSRHSVLRGHEDAFDYTVVQAHLATPLPIL